MIIAPKKFGDRIRLIAIEMEGAFGNESALRIFRREAMEWWRCASLVNGEW